MPATTTRGCCALTPGQGSATMASSSRHQPRCHAQSLLAQAPEPGSRPGQAGRGLPALPRLPCSLAPGPGSRLTRPELTEEDYPLPGSRRDCVYSRTWADLLVGAHH